MDTGAVHFVAGHNGLVGSALVRRLVSAGRKLLLRDRTELDLTRQDQVEAFFSRERPDYVYLAAAKVGGIHANSTYPAQFIRDNLAIQTHIIDAAYRHGVKRLLFLGSSCIYPRDCSQPMREEFLLTGPLEPTNSAYAVAKIAGIEMCRAYNRQYGTGFLAVMPTNLYGPRDNYDLENSHVLPALIRRMDEAKRRSDPAVTIWGSGQPLREFLCSDDLADACVTLMELAEDKYRALLEYGAAPALINIGSGKECAIRELAEHVREVVGFEGRLRFDPTRPDGTPRKLLDISRMLRLGWQPKHGLKQGITLAYADYRSRFGDCV